MPAPSALSTDVTLSSFLPKPNQSSTATKLMFQIRMILWICFMVSSCSAQVLYHRSNDDAAQKALELNKDSSLTGGLEAALKNVNKLEDSEAEIEFANLARTARSSIDATRCWGRIIYEICSLKSSKPSETSVCAQIEGKIPPLADGCKLTNGDLTNSFEFPKTPTAAALDKQIKALQPRLDEAAKAATTKAETETSALSDAASAAKDAQDYYSKAVSYIQDQSFAAGHKNEFQASQDALTELSKDLATLATIEDKRKKLSDKLQGLSQPLATLETDRLRAQLDHLKAQLRIARLRDQEEEYLQTKIVATFEADFQGVSIKPTEFIDSAFAGCEASVMPPECDRERLSRLGEALQLYSSALVWGQAIERLNELRLAREDHRFSLQTSMVEARAAQLVVSNGVQRLALYHQGGLKPEVLAQLIYAAATITVAAAR